MIAVKSPSCGDLPHRYVLWCYMAVSFLRGWRIDPSTPTEDPVLWLFSRVWGLPAWACSWLCMEEHFALHLIMSFAHLGDLWWSLASIVFHF